MCQILQWKRLWRVEVRYVNDKMDLNRSVIWGSIKQVDSCGDISDLCLGGGRLESQPKPATQLAFFCGFPKMWGSKVDWIG